MHLLPERPLPVTQLVRLVFCNTKQSLSVIWPGLLITLLLSAAAFFYNTFYFTQRIDIATGQIAKNAYFFISLAYPIILALLLFWLYLYMLNQTQLTLLNKSYNAKTAMHLTNQRYFHFLLTGIVSIVILSLSSALIWFFLPIILFVPIGSAMGNYQFLQAFKEAWLLVWGNWWHTLFVLLLTLLVPLFILGTLAVGLSHLIHSILFVYVLIIIKLTAILFAFSISINALLILYNDLRLRRLAQPT